MDLKKIRHRIVAFFAGVLLGPAIVWAGLETGTYISDLVATNPLSSDLASTADDHIRLLKSTIKATFPNVNGAMTATDEELSLLAGKTGTVWTSANDGTGSTLDADLLDGVSIAALGANPSATIGLSATNGSASTYLRSDGAPALSQAIAPTWTDVHTFTNVPSSSIDGSILFSDTNNPIVGFRQSGGSASNKVWDFVISGEAFLFRTADDNGANNVNIMRVDRTGTTVDNVSFPTGTARSFTVGTVNSNLVSLGQVRSTSASGALDVVNSSGVATGVAVFRVYNENTAGDNNFVGFYTEAGAGSLRGSIDYDRGGGLTRYNTTSDIRLKKNFTESPSAKPLIDCIRIESYDWKDTGNHVDHGVVAQRLDKCAPYAVSKGDVWQVDPSKLVPAMIKYIQEQDARIARLEANAARRH